MRNKLIILFSIFLFSGILTINGQKLINSPYSRFNIGSLEPAGSFRSQGMGGLSVSIRESTSIYYMNPASYSSLDTNSFIFDFGFDYSKNHLYDGVTSYSSDDMNFDHLLMGFPLAKGWGFVAGIVPFSNAYYRVTENVLNTDPRYDPLVGEFSAYHAGSGSLTSFFMGTGLNLTKNLSAGVNMTVLFGQINRLNQFDFPDQNVYHNNSSETLQLHGVNFDYGIQYSIPLKNNYFLNSGISFTSGKNYSTNYEHLVFKYTYYNTKDTVISDAGNINSTYIPGTLRLGVSLVKSNKFTIGVDYITTKWSSAKIPGSTGYAADTKSFLFGAEYIPEKYSNYSFLKRMEYRIGGHVGDNYLILNGEQVKEIGASAGIGIPLRRTLSKANLFFDFTRKSGSFTNNLYDENYYTLGISLNIYDNRWFFKRKYE